MSLPYDFDKGGPILTEEDEEILDRIWDRIRQEQEAEEAEESDEPEDE